MKASKLLFALSLYLLIAVFVLAIFYYLEKQDKEKHIALAKTCQNINEKS